VKLTKQECENRNTHVIELEDAADRLRTSVEEFNSEVERAWEQVTTALEIYNEALSNAREFAEHIANNIESFYDEKSLKWQESDRGSAVRSMQEEWAALDTEEVTLDAPVVVYEPDCICPVDHATNLEALPIEPEAS